jgi:hypothetical protein
MRGNIGLQESTGYSKRKNNLIKLSAITKYFSAFKEPEIKRQREGRDMKSTIKIRKNSTKIT